MSRFVWNTPCDTHKCCLLWRYYSCIQMPLTKFIYQILPKCFRIITFCHHRIIGCQKSSLMIFCTHVCLVNTLTSYDMHTSLTSIDNVTYEIHQKNMTSFQGVSSFHKLFYCLYHHICHHFLHLFCIHLVHLELYDMLHILLDRYKH